MKKLKVYNKIWLLIIATITLVVFLFVSILYYGSKYQDEIKNYTIATIENHVLEQNLYFNSLLNIQFEQLTNIFKIVNIDDIDDYLPYLNFIENVNNDSGLTKFIITDLNGTGLLSDNTMIDLNINSQFKDCLNGNHVIIEAAEISNDDQSNDIILMIPICADDAIIGTVGAYYNVNYLSKVLVRETAAENEFFCIINDDGKIIFSNDTGSAFYKSDDFNNILQQIVFNDFVSTNDNGQSDNMETREYFTSKDEKYYITQVATDYTGWNLVHVISASTVDFSGYFANSNMFYLMLTIILAFFVFLICSARLIFSYKKDVETEKQAMLHNQAELGLMHERYQLLARYSDVIIYELDLVNKVVYANENYEKYFGAKPAFNTDLLN